MKDNSKKYYLYRIIDYFIIIMLKYKYLSQLIIKLK